MTDRVIDQIKVETIAPKAALADPEFWWLFETHYPLAASGYPYIDSSDGKTGLWLSALLADPMFEIEGSAASGSQRQPDNVYLLPDSEGQHPITLWVYDSGKSYVYLKLFLWVLREDQEGEGVDVKP